ncbi:hypothetical protein A8139_21385 [Marinomonas primoryensis]|jgi:hypothetical protein|uniref:Uncharacterized protein n=1 Tax=Marinomonas primoryensis TaxID=178399 RepID=A0A2Z4PXC0_9GAMM|nr:hypothetical protein A8139_21385 [Marinomonas primoryensis]
MGILCHIYDILMTELEMRMVTEDVFYKGLEDPVTGSISYYCFRSSGTLGSLLSLFYLCHSGCFVVRNKS